MFHVLHRFWRWLLARLGYCGGAHFLAGAPSLPPPLTPEQEKVLLSRMAAGDAAARDDLITHNLRLVVYLAKKYESSGVPAEDMISIGTIGLIKAVNTFTPERSIKLATYASRCIGNEIEQIDENTVKASYTYELATPQRTKVTVSYTADTTGRVNLHVEYPGEPGDLPTIPAFGIEWTLPVQYSNLRFFGAGPEETYQDRKHAKLGVWSTDAFKDHAPYLMPQETGNHEDVRWAEITDEKGHGLRISRAEGAEPFAMSLQPYSSFMLEEAQHQDELPAPKHMFLRVLAEQMGVGGDDSWMSPIPPQYHIPADQPISLDVDLDLI